MLVHILLPCRSALPLGLASLGSSPRTAQECAFWTLSESYVGPLLKWVQLSGQSAGIFPWGTLWSVLDERKAHGLKEGLNEAGSIVIEVKASSLEGMVKAIK